MNKPETKQVELKQKFDREEPQEEEKFLDSTRSSAQSGEKYKTDYWT